MHLREFPVAVSMRRSAPVPLYTPEQKLRRDQSAWTIVQGVLAPVQFAVFLVSLALVIRYLMTGEGYVGATASIVVKTVTLYTIMVTGAIWEKVVFGQYLFAPGFYWEDMVSMLVLTLHTAYLVALYFAWLQPTALMVLALAAYLAYVVNAAQFIWKLRTARILGARYAAQETAPDTSRATAVMYPAPMLEAAE
jgi:3-vinyl bacteriochlorophyllide hydratase